MLSLHHCGFPLLLLWILTGVSSQQLSPVNSEVSSLEDSSVTLSYTYSQKATAGDYFFWYRQYPGKPPEFLISHSASGTTGIESVFVLKIKVEGNQISANISSAAVSDSAVYYCALRPATGTGVNKIIFGSGTSLTIEPKEETKPSYYVLEGKDTTVCLATGFSRYKEVWSKQSSATAAPPVNKVPPPTEDPNGPKGLFVDTEAVWVKGSSFFNQVALISGDEEKRRRCAADSGESGSCSRSMEPDPTVNLASLVTLGLRILFIKTIIFNVLMTLRLWISL